MAVDDRKNQFDEYAAEPFRLAPIERVEFISADLNTWQAAGTELRNLRELRLHRAKAFEPDVVEAMVTSPYLTGLRRLEMGAADDSSHLCAAGFALLGNANWPGLRELGVSGNWSYWEHHNESWVEPLLAGPLVEQLSHLALADTIMTHTGTELLAQLPRLTRLTSLDLRNGTFGFRTSFALARSPYLANLSTLDLRGNSNWDEDDEDDVR